MWRFLLGLGCFVLLGLPAQAQQWTGTAGLGLTTGYQTNTYLDPVLRSWSDRSSAPALGALTPQVGIARNARRTRLTAAARARLYPRRSGTPQFLQGHAQAQYQVSPAWTMGASGGGTRLRFSRSRDSWWALPSVQWAPTARATFTLRGGITQQYVTTDFGRTDRQTSGLVLLSGGSWLTDRVRAEGRVYWSSGRTSLAETDFGGTGVSLHGTYWPTREWSVEAEAALERVQYETAATTARDRLGRGGLTVSWHPHTAITVFAQTRASAARLAQTDEISTDVHVAAGLRLQAQRVLGGAPTPPPRRRVCRAVDNGVRVQIPYRGSGTPHVTGDFNGWSLPGTPLTQTDPGTWTTTLSLPSGEYAYRIRITHGDERRWLDLPAYAETTADAFGGTNGVCTVP